MGGMGNNIELNVLVEQDSNKTASMDALDVFVKDVWTKQSSHVTKKELIAIEKKWIKDRSKYLQLFGSLQPVAALAGNYFKKLKEILHRTKWKFDGIDNILANAEKKNVKNTKNKLEFLVNLGVVSSYDEHNVNINKERREEFRDPKRLFVLLQEHLYKPLELLKFINEEKKTTYGSIEKRFRVTDNETRYRTSVRWMHYLGFVKLTKSEYMQIAITEKGKTILINGV
ncbi:hypothetical protein ES705_47342 [subsurface metagenome]